MEGRESVDEIIDLVLICSSSSSSSRVGFPLSRVGIVCRCGDFERYLWRRSISDEEQSVIARTRLVWTGGLRGGLRGFLRKGLSGFSRKGLRRGLREGLWSCGILSGEFLRGRCES